MKIKVGGQHNIGVCKYVTYKGINYKMPTFYWLILHCFISKMVENICKIMKFKVGGP